ncbi:ribosomal protein L21-like protein [Lentinula aff. detonsa]|nr:ribosomal protein L21-like protein [Lentinula aff. detonsa]
MNVVVSWVDSGMDRNRGNERNFTEAANEQSIKAASFCRNLHVAPETTASALDLIRSQPSQYVVATIVGRKYVLAPRDVLTIPRLRDVKVGDVLALDEIHELGSREYTLRGNPSISPSKVKVEATVVEHTKGAMEFIFKKKRRKGYQKTKKHKQTYTRLRIGDIEIPLPSVQPVI